MINSNICDVKCINKKLALNAKSNMLPEKTVNYVSEIFEVLRDKTRINILHALSIEVLCVCDLAFTLKMSHSAISHQLMILRANKLVKRSKVGKIVYYSLIDKDIIRLIKAGVTHANHI